MYCSVGRIADYGKLSKRKLDELIAGARVEVALYKKDPMDFVLWKPSNKGDPSWASPCNIRTPGRPGWHIECSAMAMKFLGPSFDIHCGGVDNMFLHVADSLTNASLDFVNLFLFMLRIFGSSR